MEFVLQGAGAVLNCFILVGRLRLFALLKATPTPFNKDIVCVQHRQ